MKQVDPIVDEIKQIDIIEDQIKRSPLIIKYINKYKLNHSNNKQILQNIIQNQNDFDLLCKITGYINKY
jgi:ribosomal protein S17E